ncbi:MULTISPECIES: helix-turn-helix domain-containing protein [Sphingobacterium]|uniref:helix-turn-helix domain-containing protein n=1 Tax=Sphingobacterium TaxID=28453 RepID=UPI0013DC4247|nr:MULTISPECIES: AraC family transcriptional regulator [unclassified Sphingobacterium]
MQNDMRKCGLIEKDIGQYIDTTSAEAYVWYEENWKHDDYGHTHQRFQLTYVAEGYQYFHIEQKIYLVPQNHAIWIPAGIEHRTSSEAKTVNLMLVLFQSVPKQEFYWHVHIFPVPTVLKEMLLYASKWNKVVTEEEERYVFLNAILYGLPSFCRENIGLQIPIPVDSRLIPICNYINENYRYSFDIDMLASDAGMSVRTLQRLFKRETGITVQKYTQLIRILKSIELIDTKRYTLSEISFKVGYQSLSAFSSSYFSIMKERPKVNK